MLHSFLPGITRVIANITPILIFFVFAQLTTIQELGLLNYIIALITIIGILTDFGIPEAIQRFLPQTKNKAKLVSHAIKMEFLIVLLGVFLFFILDFSLNYSLSKGYILLLALTIIFSASNTIILIFNGLDDSKSVSRYFGFSSILFLLTTFVFYFIFNFDPIIAFLFGRLISWSVYTIIPLHKIIKNHLLKPTNLKQFPNFNKFALNSFVYIGSIAILTQWDSVLITHIDGVYINGIYKSVAFIATIPIILVTILHTRLLPFFSKLNGQRKFKKIKEELNKHLKYILIILVIGYVLQLFLYKPVLDIALKEEIVTKAGFLFPVIFLAICIQILNTPFVATLQSLGETKIIRNISISLVLTFIVVSIHLYPLYSYTLFPYLLLITNTIFLILTTIFSYTKLNFCIINNI